MFRGFLLVSLARFMPTGVAVLVSSLIFAMCHFKLQTLLPLLLLGSFFSSVFLFSRNLVCFQSMVWMSSFDASSLVLWNST